MTEPLSCVLNDFEKSLIELGDDDFVIGAGSIGNMYAKPTKLGGGAEVFINDLVSF